MGWARRERRGCPWVLCLKFVILALALAGILPARPLLGVNAVLTRDAGNILLLLYMLLYTSRFVISKEDLTYILCGF